MPATEINATSVFAERLSTLYEHLFKEMQKLVERHQTFGNWAVGGIPLLTPVPTQKELGLWYAEGRIPGFAIPGAVSVALVPGDTRVGLFLPEESLHSKQGASWLEDRIALLYDGKRPTIIQRDANRILFDRHVTARPFDADFLGVALGNPQGIEALLVAQRLAYMVTTLWVGAMRILFADGKVCSEEYLIRATQPLSPEDVAGLPSGILVQSHELDEETFASYIRATATIDQIRLHLQFRGFLEPLVITPLVDAGVL